MKKILFLTKYSPLGARSRYRVHQYLPFLEEAGFAHDVHPLFPDRYLECIYSDVKPWRQWFTKFSIATCALIRRSCLLSRRGSNYDVVYVGGYEGLPYLPFCLERWLFFFDTRVVVDCDDPIYLNYADHRNPVVRRVLGDKIPKILEKSSQVITANHHLAEWARGHNSNVTVIPTSVDLRSYPVHQLTKPSNRRTVIGWIGTPITAKYLHLLMEPLQRLRTRHDFVLKVIGAPGFEMEGIDVVGVPWSEATEFRDLFTCDIGIMPLPDDAWARGKSALKLIQYLAAEVAGVASPVGANCDVIQDGENGFLARTDEDWVEKLSLLIRVRALRRRVAREGRKTVEDRYSLQANAPRWVEVLRSAATESREP